MRKKLFHVFIEGELVGGSDIIVEMYENGELQPMIQDASQAVES